uniref:Phospholipid transfer protein n=1 Tax=Laticauda laticaudata TaxID=8630 RepID=A0A8C5SPA7_LATLA
FSELHFQPEQFLAFRINNGSIGVRFRRQLLYWFFYDVGSIKTWAEGVNIHTLMELSRDEGGRLKITNMSCSASIAHMHAGFSGTLRKVYEFVARLITRGVRYLLSQQICPALNHAGLVLLNSLLDTVPVRNPVDKYVGSDYSLLSDPHVTAESIDLDFKGMFFPLRSENETLPNVAPEPLLRETERMVYMGLSEYFFDSALFSYYRAGVLSMEFVGDEVPKDLEVLLRASFFGTIILLDPDVVDAPLTLRLQVTKAPHCTIRPSGTYISVSALLNIFLAPPDQPLILLSSLIMLTGAFFSFFTTGSAKPLQTMPPLVPTLFPASLQLLPLQAPLQTLLQMTIMPFINERTKRGVQIPLPEGMDFTQEAVRTHLGYLTIGADLHFTKGLREVIEKLRETPGPSLASTAA